MRIEKKIWLGVEITTYMERDGQPQYDEIHSSGMTSWVLYARGLACFLPSEQNTDNFPTVVVQGASARRASERLEACGCCTMASRMFNGAWS